MEKRFMDKVVVVTGGGQVGGTAARMFLEEGARLVLGGRPGRSRELVEDWQARGWDCRFVPTDIARAEDVEALMNRCVEEYGRIDVLFTAAGIYEDRPCAELPLDIWERVLSVNLTGTFLANKYALIHMLAQGKGVIVNSCSVYSLIGLPNLTAYTATMGGIRSMSQSIAATYSHLGIRVNTVCPGTIDTPPGQGLDRADSKRADRRASGRPPGKARRSGQVRALFGQRQGFFRLRGGAGGRRGLSQQMRRILKLYPPPTNALELIRAWATRLE